MQPQYEQQQCQTPMYNQQQYYQPPMYNQQQQYQPPIYDQPPQPAKEYQQPMPQTGYQPASYYPQPLIQPPVQPLYYPQPQPKQDVSVKVEVKSQTPAPSNIIAPLLIENRKTWTHSRYPTDVYCTNCKRDVVSIVVYSFGAGSWVMVLIFCLLFWPIMCLPCCVPSMQDAIHHCPNCGAVIGKKEFLF